MKKLFEQHFERTWLIIFLVMFILIMVPFPFFYTKAYIPAFGGIPVFLFGWFAHTAVTFVLIIIYYRMCMRRKEYHIYDEESEANEAAANKTITDQLTAEKEGAQHGSSN